LIHKDDELNAPLVGTYLALNDSGLDFLSTEEVDDRVALVSARHSEEESATDLDQAERPYESLYAGHLVYTDDNYVS
jgi:hypothetical protein